VANQFIFPDWVAPEALRLLTNQLQVAQFFDTSYNKEYTKEFPVGEVVRVKLPQRFLIREGLGYSPQPINRINTTVTCNQIFGVDFEWDDFEGALRMERSKQEISEQYLKPAMAQIAQEIDTRAALFAYQNANNIVGVLGTDPSTSTTFMQARQRMKELACPAGSKVGMIVPPAVNTSLVPALQALFNPSDEISREFKEGSLGKLWGFDWYESMSLFSHTAGTWAGAVTVSGANQSGTSLVITATAGDTFNVGDVFSILNVNLVNPMTRRKLSTVAKTFVITTPLTAAGGAGADTINFSPAIFGPGSQYQNVDALPASGAALTLFPGTSSPNGKSGAQAVWIHPEAFALVGVKLESPTSTEICKQSRDPKTGIPIRFVRAWDPVQSKFINRWDTVIGFGNLYPDNCAGRVLCA
jgi:hypothetical protein